MLVIQSDGQIVRRSSLGVQRHSVLLGGMHILARFTDTDVCLHNHETILLSERINRAAIAVINEPCFGGGIGKVYFQVTRLDIFDRTFNDICDLFD